MSSQTTKTRGQARAAILASAIIAVALGLASASAAAPAGYLPDTALGPDLGYTVPPPPDATTPIGAQINRMDLAMVEMAQTGDPSAREEAFVDAGAYDFDQLMGRFNAAAGTELSPTTSPILAHILRRVMEDTGAYAGLAKTAAGPRARPYIEDPAIIPCETDYLRPTDKASYPSGHATNGYAAALVLAQIVPARAPVLLARGIRYGTNRVVCGAHHPIDVEQGRLLAIAIVEKLKTNADFKTDVGCAGEEYDRSVAGTHAGAPFSAGCAVLDTRYRAEFAPPTRP